jgi:hypothetical protein
MLMPRIEGGWYVIAAGPLNGRPDGLRILAYGATREAAEAAARLLFGG